MLQICSTEFVEKYLGNIWSEWVVGVFDIIIAVINQNLGYLINDWLID